MSHPASVTTMEVVHLRDFADPETNPDLPYECELRLVNGSIESAYQCASIEVGPYAGLDPLFNLRMQSANSFTFHTFASVSIGQRFVCSSDPAHEASEYTRKNIEFNERENRANRISIAICEPLEYCPYMTLRTFETFNHSVYDANGKPIQRYDQCAIQSVDGTQAPDKYIVRDIDIQNSSVSLVSLSQDLRKLYSLIVLPSADICLCAPSVKELRCIDLFRRLRPVVSFMGECHQLELVHYIHHLVEQKGYSAIDVLRCLILRILSQLEVTKQTVNYPVDVSVQSEIDLKAALIKFETSCLVLDALTLYTNTHSHPLRQTIRRYQLLFDLYNKIVS